MTTCPFENYITIKLDAEATKFLGDAIQETAQGDFIKIYRQDIVVRMCRIFDQLQDCGVLTIGSFRKPADTLFFRIFDDDVYLDRSMRLLYLRLY